MNTVSQTNSTPPWGSGGGGFTSRYFTLQELTRSQTARQRGLDNTPDAAVVENLQNLVTHILDPLRQLWGSPLYVNSGYRSQELNRAVGGAVKSFHLYGRAADIRAANLSDNNTLYALIKELRLPVHELLKEQVIKGIPTWIHVAI
jgi:uncharacterized protein YcbK (DUF882 family)